MNNSKIKISSNIIENPFIKTNLYNKIYSPKVSDNKNHNYIINHYGTFQSNYHFFMKKIEDQRLKNLQIINQNQKDNRLRYNSMGSNKMTITRKEQPVHQIINCQSNPYFLTNKTTQLKKNDQKPKMHCNDYDPYTSMTAKTSNNPPPPLHPGYRSASKMHYPQQISTEGSSLQQPNKVSKSLSTNSKKTHQQQIKQQINKYLQVIHQKIIKKFKIQIQQQSELISQLYYQIKKLNKQLNDQQKVIKQLNYDLGLYNKSKIKTNHSSQNLCINKINYLQQQLNHTIKPLINEQSSVQNNINQKLDLLTKSISVVHNNSMLQSDITSLQNKLKQHKLVIIKNDISLSELQIIKNIVTSLNQKLLILKNFINRSTCSTAQTGYFNICQPHQKPLLSNKNQIDESISYFFHPQQLTNLQKITQIFINRQQQPIQCYTDNLNQVKYIDTNTFMFNKYGDIVKLTDQQKKYYVDRGFIYNLVH